MKRIRTVACVSLFLSAVAWSAVPCEAHRWDRPVSMTVELLGRSPEVFVGMIVAGSSVVAFPEGTRPERGEITPLAVELVVKGSFRAGDRIDAFRILKLGEEQTAPESNLRTGSMRYVVFLRRVWISTVGTRRWV